ncbi:MAG: MMPL family transporter [Thermomicrobiales bacterium]
MASLFSTGGLARASARRPWRVIGLWIAFLVVAAMLAPTLSDALTGEFKLTDSPESVRGDEILEERLRGPRPMTETIIVRSDSYTVDDAEFRATVDGVMAELKGLPEIVKSATSYYTTYNPARVSEDRQTMMIPVTLVGEYDDVTDHAEEYLAALDRAANDSAIEVLSVGDSTMNDELNTIAEEDLAKGEGIGVLVALVILVVVFGALVAAGLPLVLGIVSVFIAIGLAAVVGRFMELSFFVQNMITMIGLAVGVDYALFVVERYREERRRGLNRYDAIEIAGGTASKAVLFSGGTVVFALMGMFLVPNNIFQSLGIGAVLVVVVAIFATLTLIPAMLGLLGDKVDWPRRRRQATGDGRQKSVLGTGHSALGTRGFWARVARIVIARPVVSLVASVTLLVVMALPYLDVTEGSLGVSGLPDGTKSGAAYEILVEDFAAGTVSPVEIVVDGNAADPTVQAGIQNLTQALAANGRFGPTTVSANDAGDVTLVAVPMTLAPDSPEAYALIEHLRDATVPAAFEGVPAEVLVTGMTAMTTDSTNSVEHAMPIVFAFVLGLSFLLLLVAFRSIVVPAKAIMMNLLSVGAAYGLIVAVFQKGWGADLLGFQTVPAIESWLPLFLFCVLFGLSMDYHVFLLSRIKEHYDLSKNNTESVAVGLQSTARIITGAAAIMLAVFGGFAAGRLVFMQQMGFGLAIAVLIDATIVRSVLVPAAMTLLGDRNWYLPRWLSWLPNLHIEGAPAAAPVSTSGDD